MIPVLSREQMREFDRHAIEVCRVPSLALMENAGRNAATVLLRALGERPGRVVIVAGPGNNGGDGFVVARRLLTLGHDAEVFLVGDPERLKGDARINHDAWRGLGGRVSVVGEDFAFLTHLDETDAVVDALLGTGLDRPVEGILLGMIQAMNGSRARRFALDVPSGLDANTGSALGAAVRAEATITFGHLKLGLLTPSGAEHAGDVHAVDIGVPSDLSREVGHSALGLENVDAAELIGARRVSSHKGSAGHVLVIAGSMGKTGAALLVARGALRAGAGLATLCTSPEAAAALDQRVLEEMTFRLDPDHLEASLDVALARADVVAIGPGLGLDERARRVVDHVVQSWDGPKVVDADALSLLAGRVESMQSAKGSLILTPHPGELGRLLETSATEVERDRFGALARIVERSGAVVVLKGARTLIGAPGEVPAVILAGSPVLATAGSGDVLTGVIAACCQELEPRFAAMTGAHLHALAGERWAERTGADRGLVAHEIADALPETLAFLHTLHAPAP